MLQEGLEKMTPETCRNDRKFSDRIEAHQVTVKCGARTNFGERAVILEILLNRQQPRPAQVDVDDELVQVCEEACRASCGRLLRVCKGRQILAELHPNL